MWVQTTFGYEGNNMLKRLLCALGFCTAEKAMFCFGNGCDGMAITCTQCGRVDTWVKAHERAGK